MTPFLSSFLPGFALGFSLILAIGAQNAFVLKCGLRREHVLPVVLICVLADAVLIFAGVAGSGALARELPWFETAMRYGGAAFLIWYGLQNALSAWRGGASLAAHSQPKNSLKSTLMTLLAMTFLNPHIYLDTLVLIGSISAQYEDSYVFGAGALLSSILYFFALGFGARLLSPLFANAIAWRILDVIIALTMFSIAISLLI